MEEFSDLSDCEELHDFNNNESPEDILDSMNESSQADDPLTKLGEVKEVEVVPEEHVEKV